jgi:hypothetical protein
VGFNYWFGYWGSPVVGPLLFVLAMIFPSAFDGWVTLRAGSVWPAAIGHGADYAVCLLMVNLLRGDPDRLIGPLPVGIVGSLGYAVLELLIFSSARALTPIGCPRPLEPLIHQERIEEREVGRHYDPRFEHN